MRVAIDEPGGYERAVEILPVDVGAGGGENFFLGTHYQDLPATNRDGLRPRCGRVTSPQSAVDQHADVLSAGLSSGNRSDACKRQRYKRQGCYSEFAA